MENVSSLTQKIDFDKESGIDRSYLQVIYYNHFNPIKYIFLGEVSEGIRKILNKFENGLQIDKLSSTEKNLLEENYGINWDRKLGFSNFIKHDFLPLGMKLPSLEDAESILDNIGIYSKFDGYKWLQKNYNKSDEFYNVAGAINKLYGKDGNHNYINNIKKKYVPYRIFTDDNIKMIKKKIMLVTKQKNTITPEMQFLWYYSNNKFVSLNFNYSFYKNEDLDIFIDPYESLKLGYKDNLSNKLLSSEYKVINKNEHIFLDFPVIQSNIIFVSNVIDVIDYAREKNLIDDYVNFNVMFIQKYWIYIQKNSRILKYSKNKQINVEYNDINNFIKNQKVIKNETKVFNFMENMEINLVDKIPCILMQIYFHINEGVRKLGNRFINLEKIFYFLEPKDNLVFVSFASYNFTKQHEYIYKIKADIVNDVNKLIRIYEEWIAKERELKENSLTIKFTDNWKSFITIKLYEDGYYKIITNWQEEEETSIKNVDNSLKIIKSLFNTLNSMDIYLPKKKSNKIILPDLRFLNNPNTNTIIHNMEVHILFDIKEKINYDIFTEILNSFKSYLSIIKLEDEINKYWKKKDMDNIIDVLRRKELLDMKKLKKLDDKSWKNMVLFKDKDINSLQVKNFKSFIDSYNQTSISFVYKRFSEFYNKKRIFKYISEIISLYGYRSSEICENINNSQIAVIKEVINKFGGNIEETKNHISEWCEINNDEGRRSSGGIKCTIQEIKDKDTKYRVKIQGLRNFTGSSDVTRLIRKIYFLILRLINIYKNYNFYKKDPSYKEISKLDIDYESIDNDEDNNKNIDTTYDNEQIFDDLNEYDFDNDYDININTEDFNNIDTSFDDIGTNESKLDEFLDDIVNKYESDTKEKNSYEQEQIKIKGEYRLGNLLNKDYDLFKKYPNQKKSYAQQCQPSYRQPIVLSKEEFNKLDKSKLKLPKDSKDGFVYRGNYYICPEIWCDSLKQVISEKQLTDPVYRTELSKDGKKTLKKIISGKCPDGEEAIIVKDWKAKGYNEKKETEGRDEYPGFLSPNLHPKELCVPCCMSTDQSNSLIKSRMFKSCLNEEYKKAKGEIEISEQKLRYIFKESKILEEDRFGFMNSKLNILINDGKRINESTIKDKFNSILRIGISKSNNSFIDCIRKVYNLYNSKNTIDTQQEFREYIANNLKDELLFLSLNNGNIKNIFTQNNKQSVKDVMNNYKEYIIKNNVVNISFIWNYLSQELSYLFKNGINIFIFDISPNNDISLRCPVGENYELFYNPDKDSIIITFQDNKYELLVRVNGKLNVDPFFGEKIYKQIIKYYKKCYSNEDLINGYKLYETLSKIRSNKFKIIKQYINKYNKCSYLICSNNLILPINLSGPIYKKNIEIVKNLKPTINYKETLKNITEINRLLRGRFEFIPIAKYINNQNLINGIKLEGGYIIPVKNSQIVKDKLPSIHNDINFEIDNLIYTDNQKIDDRIIFMSNYKYEQELYERFRFELSLFLKYNKESKETREIDESKRFNIKNNIINYWYKINGILYSYDNINYERLPLWAKRSLLIDLFLEDSKDYKKLIDIFTTDKKKITNKNTIYETPNIRNKCIKLIKKDVDKCNDDIHCSFDEKCKLYIPKDLRIKLTLKFIEELLYKTLERDEVFGNEVNTILNLKKYKYNNDYLIIDKQNFINLIRYIKTQDKYLLNIFKTGELVNLKSKENVDSILKYQEFIKEQLK